MKIEIVCIFGVFLAFALLELIHTRFFAKPHQTRDDAWVEIVGSFVLLVGTQPLIMALAYAAMGLAFPEAEGRWAGIPVLAAIALFLVFEDMMQYWWHRTSHSVPFLYNLHRAHHNAEYMSVRIVYRNNIFYYLLMPSLWFAGALVYLGLGWVYIPYVIVKQTVITAAHSDVRWDQPLYRLRWLAPVMWVIERTISTPTTHSAHHGKHKEDGITHYKGNFGNLLFFWDVLFGTAKITRRIPPAFGVENLAPAHAPQQLLWPIFSDTPPVGATDAGGGR